MIQVIKASGQLEPLSIKKIRQSLSRAGADQKVIDRILVAVKPKLYDRIPTREVYRLVYDQFNQLQPPQVFHYALKPALMELGPSGYPFEKFMAKLFDRMGYQTKTNVIVSGHCVSHEVDVVVSKGKEKYLLECKFHQRPGTKTTVKDALYIQARFEDIKEKSPGVYQAIWLVTNTKLTSEAIAYGNCRQMKLLAWHYPAKAGLEQLLEQYKIHPVTSLTFLNRAEKQLLFARDLILCSDLKNLKDKQLSDLGLTEATIKKIRSALN